MIWENSKIRVPRAEYIRVKKNDNNKYVYSFFFNKSIKNDETGEWEVKERYVINLSNIEPNPDSDITITKIKGVEPRIMSSNNGKEYLNCVLYIEAENYQPKNNDNNSNYNYNNSNNNYNNTNYNYTQNNDNKVVETPIPSVEEDFPF